MSLDFLAPSIGIIKAIRCNGNVLDTGHCEEIPDNIYYRIEFQLSDGIHVAEWVQPDNVRPVRAPFAIRSASVNDNCVIQWMTGKARFLIFESLPDPIICGETPPPSEFRQSRLLPSRTLAIGVPTTFSGSTGGTIP